MEDIGTVARDTEVTGKIRRLQETVNILEERVNTLDSRLESVMRPSAPETVGKDSEGPSDVPLAEDIQAQERRIQRKIEQLNGILDRLEV
jgi:hypothetical protein